ncbi:SLC13 family permease [Methanofollis tationis]|uniref:SLC13 family permease n=1 Tax=Methanofollis tationis TaxID=81417 RepID=UPI001FEC2EF6|nr:SLC13 family permease [Methanofollis tationis]
MIAVTAEQGIVFVTLIIALVLFVYGRWRYDIVALLSLFIVTLTGVVGWDQAFLGFANPAVITVAAVLVISRGLQNAGVVDLIVHRLSGVGDGPGTQVSLLTGIVTAFSAFMNNIGALALLLPVGIFGFAIAIAAMGLVPIQIVFPMAAVFMVLTSLIPPARGLLRALAAPG